MEVEDQKQADATGDLPLWQVWYKANKEHICEDEIRPKRKLSTLNMRQQASNKHAFFIHGSCARMGQFEEQIDFMFNKLNYNVVSFDRIGCGMSDRPRGYYEYNDLEIFDDLCLIFEKYVLKNCSPKSSDADDSKQNESESESNLSKNEIIVIGHSYGTSQALRLTEKYGNKYNIQGIVLIGTPPMAQVAEKGSNLSAAKMIFYLPETVLGWMQPMLSKGFQTSAIHENSSEQLKKQELSFSGWNQPYMFRSFYQQIVMCSSDDFLNLKWRKIPICMIHGKDDALTKIEAAEKLFEEFCKDNDKKVVQLSKFHSIDEAKHQVMQEKPDKVNSLIREFVQSVSE